MFQQSFRILPTIILMFATVVPAQDPPQPAADEELPHPLPAPGGQSAAPASPAAPAESGPGEKQPASGSEQGTPDRPPAPANQAAPRRELHHEVAPPADDCPCRDQAAPAGSYIPGPDTMPTPMPILPPAYVPAAMQPPVSPGWQPPAGSLHPRYPYYSYRRPWYYRGPASLNVTIPW